MTQEKSLYINWTYPFEEATELYVCGDNQLIILEAWSKIKNKVLEVVYEGEFVKIIHNILKSDAEKQEITDTWEISIDLPHFSNWTREDAINYTNELLINIICLLRDEGFKIEIGGPHSSKQFRDELMKILQGKL